jgi:hypothetical protein
MCSDFPSREAFLLVGAYRYRIATLGREASFWRRTKVSGPGTGRSRASDVALCGGTVPELADSAVGCGLVRSNVPRGTRYQGRA